MIRNQKEEMNPDLDRSKIITFADGIPAFEDEKEYYLFPLQEGSPFFYLRSANSDLCLLMADPFTFFPDYQIDFPDPFLDHLGASESTAGLMVFCILTLGKEFKETTANLMAPLIINAESRQGMQFIPQKSEYRLRHRLFSESPKSEAPRAEEGA
ncbi:MAG: flagellar assembly protein FliW [Syntrophomonas sp.]